MVHDPAAMPNKFGDLVNADHIIAHSEEAMGLTGERDALVVVDRYSEYVDCFPPMTKTADDAHGALLDFFGRSIFLPSSSARSRTCTFRTASNTVKTPK